MKAVNFGIDLGTTNSLIAKYESGNIVIFKNPIGHKETLASVVAFRNDRILVGDKAREYMLKDAVNVFGGFKRRMGTDEKFYVVNMDENVTPVQLSTYILKELQQFVYSGERPEAAVITIPASFDTMQSNATKIAGEEAGLQEVFLLQEPIAASLAYFNHQSEENHEGHWLVYDLGGGTFDIALVKITEGEMKVVDHEGNNFLGGLDFDLMIVEQLIVPEIISRTGIEDFGTQLATQYGLYEKLYCQLIYKAEELKKELSNLSQADIDFSVDIEGKCYDFYITITQEQFNTIISKRVDETVQMLKQVLERNHLPVEMVRQTIMVGGSTFIPYVRNRLEQATGIKVNMSVDPTTAVVVGAAYYAANKYYTPKDNSDLRIGEDISELLKDFDDMDDAFNTPLHDLSLSYSYSKMSKETEEVLLVKANGVFGNYSYRIIRADGGFDTGFVLLKTKFTEFLPLLPNVNNSFFVTIYDEEKNEIPLLREEIIITQGQYHIAGQPLPKDICIEIDDKENNTTKLELVFEKNSLLPLKKTLYREISKTVKKGSDDKIILNILEGDKFTRPLSNLTIGCIEISGKDLKSDLLKGSDIEMQIVISDNRELSTEVFLVMTQQSFKNVFAITEKQISIARLKEQFNDLEEEIRKTVKEFNFDDNEVWATSANEMLSELLDHKKDLIKLSEKDRSDKKYIIAEAVNRISQAYDKIGGNDRLQNLISEYFNIKEYVEQYLMTCDFEKDRLQAKFKQLTQGENQLLRTRNPSILIKAIEQLNKLGWDVLMNTSSYLIAKYQQMKSAPEWDYKNYYAAQSIFKMADKALEQERFFEFRQHIYSLTHLVKYEEAFVKSNDFNGTGIG
jgi:molecular chaperone DnaK